MVPQMKLTVDHYQGVATLERVMIEKNGGDLFISLVIVKWSEGELHSIKLTPHGEALSLNDKVVAGKILEEVGIHFHQFLEEVRQN